MKFIPFALLHVGSQTLLVAGEGDVDHDQEEEHEAEEGGPTRMSEEELQREDKEDSEFDEEGGAIPEARKAKILRNPADPTVEERAEHKKTHTHHFAAGVDCVWKGEEETGGISL